MAFFTYPPNEATSPLFTQISVSTDTSGASIFGPESVQSAITSFSLSKPADIAATAGRTVGVRGRLTGNTNATTGILVALRSETRRSTLSASVSDSVSFSSLSLGKAVIDFTAASIPATYTSTGNHRAIQIDQTFGSNLTGNTLAISNIVGIEFTTDSQANTGRKTNILMSALSGGTLGNAQIADNTSYSGDWFINSTSTKSSLFSGQIGIGQNPLADRLLYVGTSSATLFTGTTQRIIEVGGVNFNSNATNSCSSFASNCSALPTTGVMNHFHHVPASVSGTVTRERAFAISEKATGAGSVTNFAGIADNTTFTGDWFINSTSTNKSSFTGALATTRADVASAATITALASTRSFVKLTGSTATALQGITAGVDGQKLTLVNLTGANLTVANENAGATAANRITTMTGADVVTTANGAAEFIYDTGSSRWICLYVTA